MSAERIKADAFDALRDAIREGAEYDVLREIVGRATRQIEHLATRQMIDDYKRRPPKPRF